MGLILGGVEVGLCRIFVVCLLHTILSRIVSSTDNVGTYRVSFFFLRMCLGKGAAATALLKSHDCHGLS